MSSPFEYTAFRDPDNQIRLLELHSRTENVSLSGSLRIYDKDELPDYEAISYTWGDSHPLYSVQVNGQALSVQSNCHYALSQLRLPNKPRLLWIDYVCINQADVTEKGHQVQRMAQIFQQASRVLVSLGRDADDSDQLVDTAWSLYSACERAKSDAMENGRSPHRTTNPQGAYLPIEIQETAYTWIRNLGDSELRSTFKAFVRFSIRAYWTRLWVLPELRVASSLILHCGHKLLSLEALEILRDALQDLRNEENFQRRASTHDFGSVHKCGVHCLPLARLTYLARRKTSYRGLLPLSASFLDISSLHCSDVRDRIYALLPVYEWPSELPPLVVDYNKTRLELVYEVVMCCPTFEHITRLLKALQIK